MHFTASCPQRLDVRRLVIHTCVQEAQVGAGVEKSEGVVVSAENLVVTHTGQCSHLYVNTTCALKHFFTLVKVG